MKNPYEHDTPEWQLFENFASQDSLIREADEQIAKAELRRRACIDKRARYETALRTLDPTFAERAK